MTNHFDNAVSIFVGGLNEGIKNYNQFFDNKIAIFEVGCYLLYKTDFLLYKRGFNAQLRQFMGMELMEQLIKLTSIDSPIKLPRGKKIDEIINQRVHGYSMLMDKCKDVVILHDNILEIIRQDLHKKGVLISNYTFSDKVVASYGDGKSVNLDFENVMIPKLALLEFDKTFTEKFLKVISGGSFWDKYKSHITRMVLGILLLGVIYILRGV